MKRLFSVHRYDALAEEEDPSRVREGVSPSVERHPETAISLEIVLPVREMEGLIAECLDSLLPQLRDGDRLTVIDDGSTDSTEAVARAAGANVITLPESRGPYFARHIVAARSTADAILFVDGRCRAEPHLLDAHREMLARPGVALSCTNVSVEGGTSFAARVARSQDMFSLDRYVSIPGRPDYFPTSNLGVRTSAYVAVGGFRAMRSGADADLCWRIQAARLGTLACDRTVAMHWVPRDRFADLIRQWYRYGQGSCDLRSLYANAVLQSDFAPIRRGDVARRRMGIARKLLPDPSMALAGLFLHAVFRLGFLRRKLGGQRHAEAFPTYGSQALTE